ncbi:MAG: response regulator transcription factor [Deltaproteobacteria bacterium]|nr:response regulator transcription factor [Deltaproteobacteria bacterium]
MPHRILVVDDEPDILELVRQSLAEAGYAVATATTARDAIDALHRSPPDLAVIDLMLPDLPGTEICRLLRSRSELADVLVLLLTAKGEELDRVVGFELGADDYVTKPFSPRELVLRVRALLRRRAGTASERSDVLERGPVRLDLGRHRCFVDDEEVLLTAKEFELLATLMRRPGRVRTRERLLDEVWGSDVTVTMRTIDTHLKRLREKLGRGGDLIETVRGVGYRFAE